MATDTNIRPSSRVVRSEAIIFTELDDTVVMMDVEQGRYYELDPVGARVWALVESSPRIAEVCEALVAEYEVAPDTCEGDVRAFLDELHRRAVVRIVPGTGANEIADDDTRDPEAPSISDGEAVAARLGQVRTKLAWITPTIETMAVARVADGKDSGYTNWVEDPNAAGYNAYSPSS